ncbi:MAG: Hsp20/alpha crystallin family protein [Acidobacteria bacterium]|nr:Hsp20/alpha crystallin family protein [Acidobacteriota bacterium]
MGAGRWNSTHELLRLQDRLNRMFGPSLDDDDEMVSGQWTPPCDIIETADAVVLRAELPGVREEDIEIHVEGGLLTLRGEKEFEKRTDRSYHRIERAYGSFMRTFTLPRTVDAEGISANYERGVLELTMPKRSETRPRQIRIDVKD